MTSALPSTTTLLSTRGRAAARDSKTVLVYGFEVPAGTEALALTFDYAPRVSTDREANARLLEGAFELHTRRRRATMSDEELARHRAALHVDRRAEGLDNLLNVVLIDARGTWRGRWDRNPASDKGALLLGLAHASRGFLPGELPEGKWTAAIECHGIFGEDVEFAIQVSARPAPSADEIGELTAAPAPRATRRPSDRAAPARSGPGWYFGEMHSHTVNSDGKWELAELAERASAVSADFLCLTDHNTVSGLLDPPELPLTLVPGMELTTFSGHHPMYGMTSMIPWHIDGRVLPLAETSKHARSLGALVSVAHPFVPGDPLCTGCRMVEGLDPSTFDLMEVWYRRWDSVGTDNEAAYALWNRYWAEGHRVTAVAARDWHGKEQDGPFPGELPFTGVYAEGNDAASIVRGLRSGRVIMSGGPIVDVRFVLADGQTTSGHVTSDRVAALEIEVSRLDEPVTLRIFRCGALACEVSSVEKDGVSRFDGIVDRAGYYRAELWAGKRPRVITNHVVCG